MTVSIPLGIRLSDLVHRCAVQLRPGFQKFSLKGMRFCIGAECCDSLDDECFAQIAVLELLEFQLLEESESEAQPGLADLVHMPRLQFSDHIDLKSSNLAGENCRGLPPD